MLARSISSVLHPHFWFARKRYLIVKADASDAINKVLIQPRISFSYDYISGLDTGTLKEFHRMEMELGEFVHPVARMTIRKALSSGSTLVVARNCCNGEIAACCICYVGPAERQVLAIRDDEFYIGNSYTRSKYRGMSLQAIAFQRGFVWMNVHGLLRRTAVAIVKPDNKASMRGLSKIGFTEVGWLVEQRIFRFVRIIWGCDDGQGFCRLVFGNPV